MWIPETARVDRRSIRNFSIIAHSDHDKTTLSDRLLERSGALSQRAGRADMTLEAFLAVLPVDD